MKARTLRLAAMLLALPGLSQAANNWVNIPAISPTTSLVSGQLCYTDGRDLACNATSPYLTSGGLLGIGIVPGVPLEVSGTVSATNFVGNGAGLTGVVASSGDRIVSGTTSMVAISATGFISITQAGTNTGWFDPTHGLVTIGLSSTGPVSGTNGYFSGNVGIGTSTPINAQLEIYGTSSAPRVNIRNAGDQGGAFIGNSWFIGQLGMYNPSNTTWGIIPANSAKSLFGFSYGGGVGSLSPTTWGSSPSFRNILDDGSGNFEITGYIRADQTGVGSGNLNNGIIFGAYPSVSEGLASKRTTGGNQYGLDFYTASNVRLSITNSGNVEITSWTGINFTTTPTAPLEVSGTVSATNFVGNGAGLTGVVASSGDRIVSGTTSMIAVSNTGFISVTQSGTNTAWFDPTRGLVTIGVSSTGPISGTNGYFSGLLGVGVVPVEALQVQGNIRASGNIFNGGNIYMGNSAATFGFRNNATKINSPAAAVIHLGDLDAAAPLSQTLGVQGVVAGTNNTAGLDFTIAGSQGTGNAQGGGILFQTAPAGTAGSAQNPLVTAMVISGSGNVGINTSNPNANLEVSGTISATHFVGDGSQLTGVVASSGDRIVSGTTSMIAVSNTGFISVTQSGTNTAWFDPTHGLVTIGVSSTGVISGTSGYFNSWDIIGSLVNNDNVALQTTGSQNQIAYLSTTRSGASPVAMGYSPYNYKIFGFGDYNTNDNNFNPNELGIDLQNHYVGIGTISPTTKLEVNGTVSDTGEVVTGNVIATAPTGTVSATYGYFTYISATSGLGGASGDRIVSGTSSVVVNSASSVISITNAGVTTGYFNSNGVLTVPGVSATANLTSVTSLYASGNVGIGTTTPSTTLHVNGTGKITGHIAFGNSADVDISNYTYAGYTFGSGLMMDEHSTTTGVEEISGIDNYLTYDPGADASSVPLYISDNEAYSASGNTQNIKGMEGVYGGAFHEGSGTIGSVGLIGVEGASGNYGPSNVPTTTGGYFYTGSFSGGQVHDAAAVEAVIYGSAGTVTNSYGLLVDAVRGGGTIVNDFGLYINDQSPAASGAINGYNIYSQGAGINYFGGNVGIGIGNDNPTATLDVDGTISATNVYVTATTGTVSATYGYFTYISATAGWARPPRPAAPARCSSMPTTPSAAIPTISSGTMPTSGWGWARTAPPMLSISP